MVAEASIKSKISVPGKQRRRSVTNTTVRKFSVKDSQKKAALPRPATISKRSRKTILFRIFTAGTSFFILITTLSLWRDRSLRTTVRTDKSETLKQFRFSPSSHHEDSEETEVISSKQVLSQERPEYKNAPAFAKSHETHQEKESIPHQNDKVQSNPERPGEPMNSFKDVPDKNPDEEDSEKATTKSIPERTKEVPNIIEWYTRDDYKAGMRPICRINNPIVLSNGTILIPESMQSNVKVLRRCGLGLYSFYPSSGPSGVDNIVDVGVDFALTIHLERFQEPTHVTSVYLTEHVLKSSFLFDTFEGNAKLTAGVKQTHCIATETEENCNHDHPQKNVLRPGIFVPRRIERSIDLNWSRMFVDMFGKAYGRGDGAVHLNASSVLTKSHAGKTVNLVGTRFRSILTTDGMFRHLPLGALQHSRFFSGKSASTHKRHQQKKSGKCSVTIGVSKSSDPVTGFDASSELKEKLEMLSKFASFAQFNVKEFETSAVTNFEEHIEQMRDLDVFVAGSGEDMSTIGFLSPESVVFELMPFGINPDTHRNLARALNIVYHTIKGKPKDEGFKQCITLEVFGLRKKGKLQLSENPPWHEPVMKAWEAAVAEFVMSGTSNFDILTAKEPVKNYYSKLCALKQKIDIGMEDATRQIIGAAKEICNVP